MWAKLDRNGDSISMIQHDFGIALPTTIKGLDVSQTGSVRIQVKKEKKGEVLVEKNYDYIEDNTLFFELTEEESELLTPGSYVYVLDWYESGAFMCNIVNGARFKVVEKA